MKQITLAITLLALLGSAPGSASGLSDSADLRQLVHGEITDDQGKVVDFLLTEGAGRLMIGEAPLYTLQVEAVEGDRVRLRLDEVSEGPREAVLASQALVARLGGEPMATFASLSVRVTRVSLERCPAPNVDQGDDGFTREFCYVICQGRPPVCCDVPDGVCCGAYGQCGNCTTPSCDNPPAIN